MRFRVLLYSKSLFMFKNFKESLLTKRVLLGFVIGGIAGYLYYYFIGCSGGTCPITSNPWITTFYFAFAGVLLTYKHKTHEQDSIH